MNNAAFTICLNSLHLPDKSRDSDVWAGISPESEEIIQTLYKKFQISYSTAGRPDNIESKINGSIFGLCINEGYVLLRVDTDRRTRNVRFSGFLLRKDESLRTAWRLVRWQLLFLCAGGWKRNGKVELVPSVINEQAAQMKFDKTAQEHLIQIGQAMLAAEVPYSFAFTNYSRLELPLQFSSYADSGSKVAGDAGTKIIIDPSAVMSIQQSVVANNPLFSQCYLMHTNHKTFIKNYKGPDPDIRTTIAGYVNDEVWFFRVLYGDIEFQKPLDRNTSMWLSQDEGINFSIIYRLAYHAMNEAGTYFNAVNIRRNQQQQEQYAPPQGQAAPPQPQQGRPGNFMEDVSPIKFNNQGAASEPEKKPEKEKGGIFSRFRHKK
ncbi:MAG: hypothetical protein IIZ18_04700 [Ruminococcus sp.]|nr:hypothetical protein [Ruminococcus sp.]